MIQTTTQNPTIGVRRAAVVGFPSNVIRRTHSSIKDGSACASAPSKKHILRLRSQSGTQQETIHKTRQAEVVFIATACAMLLLSTIDPAIIKPQAVDYYKEATTQPVAHRMSKIPKDMIQRDDDKGLQIAFDVEFTCQEVVNAGAEQCGEKDDSGRTVRFYCPVACKVSKAVKSAQAQKTNNHVDHSRAVVDGAYNKAVFEAGFTRCAAVGSGNTCAQPHGRRQGCACAVAAQCAAVGGATACIDGFCSYERM